MSRPQSAVAGRDRGTGAPGASRKASSPKHKIVPEREWRTQRELDRPRRRPEPEPRYISSRRLRIIPDEDLGESLVERLSHDKRFKLIRPRKRITDLEIWAVARREHALLVTGNSTDFWLDRRFRIEQTEGLLVLVGNTTEERIRSFRHAIAGVDFLGGYRRYGHSKFMMVKSTPNGSVKFYGLGEDDQVVDFDV